MLSRIAYYSVAGWSLVYIIGILAFVLMLVVFLIPWLREQGWKIKFKWHPWLAWGAMIAAIVHLVLALSIKYGW